MSLENNPLKDGSTKVNEDKLNGGKVTVTVSISKRKNLVGRLKNKLDNIHLDKPHAKLFGLMYAKHIASIVQSFISMSTLCLFNPDLTTTLHKMIAVQSCDVNNMRKHYADKKEEKSEAESAEAKEEDTKTDDEMMDALIAKLKDKTIYDTFGNPIKQ